MISAEKIKIYTVLALVMMWTMPMLAETPLGPSIVPSNVVAVYPEPDTRVNLAPTEYPMGVQQISVKFNKEVTVNRESEGVACVYLNGDETPLQKVGVSGASIDFTNRKMGWILFPYSCKGNGIYRITIPEGFWILEGSTPTYSPALELYYEIFNPQVISPTKSLQRELSEFRLYFPDYQEATLIKPERIELFKFSMTESCPLTVAVGKNSDGTPANYIQIKLNEPITEEGEYSLYIRSGAAGGIYYETTGEGQQTACVEPNIEAIYRYTVSQINPPAIVPEEGEVNSFTTFQLTVPEGSEFWFINDKAVNYLYKLNADGSFSNDTFYRLVGQKIEGTDKIVLTIVEDGEPVENLNVASGEYALQLASGLFSGSWNGDFMNSAPFVYYYEVIGVPDGVESVSTNEGFKHLNGIYTIDGKKISESTDKKNIDALPTGIYIIDGKKKFTHF